MLPLAITEKIRPATPGSSRTSSIVTLAWLRSMLMPRMTMSSMFAVSSFAVVPTSLLKLERTSNSTPNFLANSTARDCITFEPAPAISSNSS